VKGKPITSVREKKVAVLVTRPGSMKKGKKNRPKPREMSASYLFKKVYKGPRSLIFANPEYDAPSGLSWDRKRDRWLSKKKLKDILLEQVENKILLRTGESVVDGVQEGKLPKERISLTLREK